MTVQELIEVLQKCDPNLPIATHANNHTAAGALNNTTRVGYHEYYELGKHVIIGNFSKGEFDPVDK